MRSGGQWAVAVALLAGVVFAWPTCVRNFGLHPGPMGAALLVYGAVANTMAMNLLVWPVLAWGILRSRSLRRTSGATSPGPAWLRDYRCAPLPRIGNVQPR